MAASRLSMGDGLARSNPTKAHFPCIPDMITFDENRPVLLTEDCRTERPLRTGRVLYYITRTEGQIMSSDNSVLHRQLDSTVDY